MKKCEVCKGAGRLSTVEDGFLVLKKCLFCGGKGCVENLTGGGL